MQRYQDSIILSTGQAVVGASVQVLTYPAGAVATIYSDNGSTTTTNPLITDGNGHFAFYAADARYSLVITKVGIAPITVSDILLEDPADGSAALSASGGAALVGFLPSGSGAGPRVVQAKLREIVSWTDFYANGSSGALVDPTGVVDSTGGIQAAVNALTSGGIANGPPGTYKTTSTVTVSIGGTVLKGSRAGATVISFVPSVAGAAFTFSAGASLLSNCGIEDIQFTSSDTTTAKDMVRASDVSFFSARGIVSIDNAWKGNTSVGFRLRGREEIRIRDCNIYTDKPIVVEANPNYATYMLDHSSVEACDLTVTAALTNPCVDFTGSGAITNIAFKRVAFVRGAGAIKCNLTSATSSNVFEIENCRAEQTAGTTQYALDFSESGGTNIQGLSIEKFMFDPALGGIKLRNCLYVSLKDILLLSTTKTNLDVDATVNYLNLHNFFSATGGTISGLANVSSVTRIGYVIGAAAAVNEFTTLQTIGNLKVGTGTSFATFGQVGEYSIINLSSVTPAVTGTGYNVMAGSTDTTLYLNAPVAMQFRINNVTVGSFSSTAMTIVGGFGCNGATAQVASTGYGTPTNVAKQASFDATTITLPNLAKSVGQLIIDLKSFGFLAA